MHRFGATNAIVRRKRTLWPYFALAPLLPILGFATDHEGVAGFFIFVEVLALFFALPSLITDELLKTTGERKVARLEADREGVHFGDKLALRREDIEASSLEPFVDGQCQVHLWGRRAQHDMVIVLEDEKRARLLLDALDLRDDRHAARFVVETFPLRTPKTTRLIRGARIAGLLALIAGLIFLAAGSPLVGFLAVPMVLAYFGLLRVLRQRSRITLGADALVVREPIALSDIERVTSGAASDATVGKKDGHELLLRFDGRDSREKRDAFVSRLSKSLAQARARPAVTEMLVPAGRERGTWLEALRSLGQESFRTSGIATEDLWDVVEHAAAEPAARAGALAVLVPRLDAAGRVRIGALVDATAKPEVRAALEVAAQDDATDEAVLEAFHR